MLNDYSFPGTAVLAFFFMLIISPCRAQLGNNPEKEYVLEIYKQAEKEYGIDQLLSNGVFFEDIYRGSTGHPYLIMDSFCKASIIYHNKKYENVDIKYDIHAQKVIIQLQQKKSPLILELTKEYISEFNMDNMQFRKTSLGHEKPMFYQVIDDSGTVQCFYDWYKIRKEVINADDKLIYSFTKDLRISYLYVDGTLSRYSSNRSFIKLFPDEMEQALKRYLREYNLKVKKASDSEIKNLINHCQDILDKRKM